MMTGTKCRSPQCEQPRARPAGLHHHQLQGGAAAIRFTRDDAGVGKEDHRFQDKDRLIAQGPPFQLVAVSRAEGRETWRGEAAGTGRDETPYID